MKKTIITVVNIAVIGVMTLTILLTLLASPFSVNASETAVYSEGFENSNGGYTHTGTSDQWQWGTPANPNGPASAHSGLKCWGTNLASDVPLNSESYLTSPPISLPSVASDQLMRIRFYAWIAVDEMYDRGEFQVSSNGASWVTLAQLFHRMQGNWAAYDFDVSNYAGGSIYLRFHLHADGANAFSQSSLNNAGLYIDDIKITVFDSPATKTILTLEAQEDQSAYASCPWVFPWTGSGFTQDNDIYSTARGADKEYTDYYELNTPLVQAGDRYLIDLRELTQEISYTDLVKLMVVDHGSSTEVAVDENGNVWTYSSPAAPVTAVDGKGQNLLNQLTTNDGKGAKVFNGDYILLDFSNVDTRNGATLVLQAVGFKDDGNPGTPTGERPCLFIQTQDSSGNWVNRHYFYPRNNYATVAFDLTQYLTTDKQVRLCSKSCHTGKYQIVDYVALDNKPQSKFAVHSLAPLSAEHSINGGVLSQLISADNQYASMNPGETISLSFEVPTMENEARDFVFQTKGYYVATGTYFISTWDGSAWAERDGWSIAGSGDQTHTFEMSLFLPDPNGQYRVRIWQDFWYEPAAIDYVGLTHAGTPATMSSAFDMRNNVYVTSLLTASDDNRLSWNTQGDYPNNRARNRWVEINFTVQGSQNLPPTTNPVVVTNLASTTPTVSWTFTDQNGDSQTMYEVEVWSAQGGSGANMWDPAAGTGTATSVVYAGLSLTPGQTYYARVKAFDGKDWGQWSETPFAVSLSQYQFTLTPATATNTVGVQHTVTAAVKDSINNPVQGVVVTFTITSGPNAGLTGQATTNVNGEATFSWSSQVPGTDTVQASIPKAGGGTITTTGTKEWVPPGGVIPEVPVGAIMATAGCFAALGAFYFAKRRRFHL